MIEQNDFFRVVEEICARDDRFKPDAYEFVMQAITFTQQSLGRSGHVTGKELAEGMRQLALKQYGPMARTVLNHWGISRTADLGAIVFLMIDRKLLAKTETDSVEDFADVYDFDTALRQEVKDIAL